MTHRHPRSSGPETLLTRRQYPRTARRRPGPSRNTRSRGRSSRGPARSPPRLIIAGTSAWLLRSYTEPVKLGAVGCSNDAGGGSGWEGPSAAHRTRFPRLDVAGTTGYKQRCRKGPPPARLWPTPELPMVEVRRPRTGGARDVLRQGERSYLKRPGGARGSAGLDPEDGRKAFRGLPAVLGSPPASPPDDELGPARGCSPTSAPRSGRFFP